MHRSGKKDDVKRKKELDEAKARLDECERAYSGSIVNANTCRKQHELFKGSIYCASRILATDSDTKLSQSLEHSTSVSWSTANPSLTTSPLCLTE